MNMINKEINDIVSQLCWMEEIEPNQDLRKDLGINSLKMVDLIVKLEEHFKIEIQSSDLNPANLIIVSDLYELVQKYRKYSQTA